MLLKSKVVLRLGLLIAIYLAYLISFNFLTASPLNTALLVSDSTPESSLREEPRPRKAKNHTKKICKNDDELDDIMQDYVELHNKHLADIEGNGKFIVFSTIDETGLGNRIPTLVSTFLLALLTNRGFMVHWPFINESINAENEHIGMVAFEKLFKAPFKFDCGQIPEFYDLLDNQTSVITSVEGISGSILCGDIENEYSDVKFLIVYGWRPFFDMIFLNELYQKRIQELGLQSLVHKIAQCLMQPIPEVDSIIQKYKLDNYVHENHQVVGIHLRKLSAHGLTSDREELVWDNVRAKYPPSLPSTPNSASWNLSTLYFLASDTPNVTAGVPSDFQPYVVRVLEEDTSRHTVLGLARALADMWLLGQSVELFGAQATTFIAATRTMFNITTNILTWGDYLGPHMERVGELPCFKWWDAYSQQPEFPLSCFLARGPKKKSLVC